VSNVCTHENIYNYVMFLFGQNLNYTNMRVFRHNQDSQGESGEIDGLLSMTRNVTPTAAEKDILVTFFAYNIIW